MKLGLIGNPLKQSWSPQIHSFFLKTDYQLIPLEESELKPFLEKRDFDGINVTIPYKQTVIPFLDELDETASDIGAVNTIVNHDGKLKGYNTDCLGLEQMLKEHRMDLKNMHTAILGSGGASKAAQYAVRQMKGTFDVISRSHKPGTLSYEEMYERAEEYDCLLNATPVGMIPRDEETPVDLDRMPSLKMVIDLVANPMRTRLQFEASQRKIQNCGGLDMLVCQAFEADERFTERKLNPERIEECIRMLKKEKQNIVLIGMPSSGKTTLAEMVSSKTGMQRIEMDDEAVRRMGMNIADCFKEKGEAYFRKAEEDTARDLRNREGCIVSTGGGVIKNERTMQLLSENGLILWIQRDLDQLMPSADRPLSQSREDLLKLYEQRMLLYQRYSDIQIDNRGDLKDTVSRIIRTMERGKEK